MSNMAVIAELTFSSMRDGFGSTAVWIVYGDAALLLEEIARACPDTRIRPSFTLVLTGPSGGIGGFLGVTAFY